MTRIMYFAKPRPLGWLGLGSTGIMFVCILLSGCSSSNLPVLEGKQWEKLTLTFEGPELSESSDINPFLDYRLDVTFSQGEHSMTVPGFFAADGNAAESSAESGNTWQVRFRPDRAGEWTYQVRFRNGEAIAVADRNEGTAIASDGQSGTIQVAPAPAGSKGRLKYVGTRYQQFTGTGEYFLKGGADSPENFLAYVDFDNTYRYTVENREGEADADTELHQYEAHLKDWSTGDPTWKDGKGKAMIGALNYLAGKGMNVAYMLTMNIEGDGKDVFPYLSHEDFRHFDCSKLDQWEIVFDHMDDLDMMIHLVTQETENELLLDDGNTTFDRRLYYRELIARFGHHRMLTWNMGEENGPAPFTPNGQSIQQREDMIAFFQQHDPYHNLVVIHSHSNAEHRDHLFKPHLGNKDLEGMSMQVSDRENIHEVTKKWAFASEVAGQPWVMNMDEIGKHYRGVDPDEREDNNQDSVGRFALWGNLLAGGAGGEWYFGYLNPHNDLSCEDWRSRDRMWDYTRYALEFFHEHLPFTEMDSHDEFTDMKDAWCFAKPGSVYTIYHPAGSKPKLDLGENTGEFAISWFNPRTGDLTSGEPISGGSAQSLGTPPSERGKDWVVLVKK